MQNDKTTPPHKAQRGVQLSHDYGEFMHKICLARLKGMKRGFTDESKVEKHFLDPYAHLLGDGKTTVTEYGSGVPILSLYFAHLGRIDKIFVIENDPAVLGELEQVVAETKLPVEIIREDVESMDSYPDTEVGVSFNCLYGYAPTFLQGATLQALHKLPKITAPVVARSTHQRFGVFRHLHLGSAWDELEDAVKDMKYLFAETEPWTMKITAPIQGWLNQNGQIAITSPRYNHYDLYGLFGWKPQNRTEAVEISLES